MPSNNKPELESTARRLRFRDLIVVFTLIIAACLIYAGLLEARKRMRRAECAANLFGIGAAVSSYATENRNSWPIPPHAAATHVEVGNVYYAPGKVGKYRQRESTAQDTELSTTRLLWALARMCRTPKFLACPASPDAPSDEATPESYWDARNWHEIGYGIQVPFGKKGVPSWDCPSQMPLAADRGPYGAAMEAGYPNPGLPPWSDGTNRRTWRPWNSPNHGGDGQGVLFADAHYEWVTTPLAGVNKDNVYTRWLSDKAGEDAYGLQRIQGTSPTGNETPCSDTDTLIYP